MVVEIKAVVQREQGQKNLVEKQLEDGDGWLQRGVRKREKEKVVERANKEKVNSKISKDASN